MAFSLGKAKLNKTQLHLVWARLNQTKLNGLWFGQGQTKQNLMHNLMHLV